MARTNKGLAEFVQKALDDKCGYVWGTYGNVLTESLLAAKKEQYPTEVGSKESIIKKWLGKRVFDCIGLIKGYLWVDDAGKITYDSAQDKNANGMYNISKNNGDIKSLPETPGICLYFKGHTGVYLGGGYAIEARGSDYGVVKTKVSDRSWTNWYEIPYIDYVVEKTTEKTYEVYTSISGYISSDDAKNRKNPKNTVKAGTYYVYNEANGMVNVTTKSGTPGSWINPSDNVKSTEKTYEVYTSVSGYISSDDAKNRKNPKNTVKAGTYYVYNEANGMVNVTTKSGTPGSWINPSDNVKST